MGKGKTEDGKDLAKYVRTALRSMQMREKGVNWGIKEGESSKNVSGEQAKDVLTPGKSRHGMSGGDFATEVFS